MATPQSGFETADRTDGAAHGGSERSLGDLFRDLTGGASTLVRQEIALAKAELRESVSALLRDAGRVVVAGAVALVGVLCLVAFGIVALGDALDNYWLSALIFAVLFLAVGAVLGRSALADLRGRNLRPDETLDTLRADRKWARDEVQDLKRRIRA